MRCDVIVAGVVVGVVFQVTRTGQRPLCAMRHPFTTVQRVETLTAVSGNVRMPTR